MEELTGKPGAPGRGKRATALIEGPVVLLAFLLALAWAPSNSPKVCIFKEMKVSFLFLHEEAGFQQVRFLSLWKCSGPFWVILASY